MKLVLNEGDGVEVTFSKAGYKGPGEVVGLAYGNNWMIKIPPVEGRNSLIAVNAVHLTRMSETLPIKSKYDLDIQDKVLETPGEIKDRLKKKRRERIESKKKKR